MYGTASIPLNEQTVNEILSNASPFRGATDTQPKSSLSIFGDRVMQWSPTDRTSVLSDSKGIVRDAVKVASFIERIGTAFHEDLYEMLDEINKVEDISKFEPALEKIAKLDTTSKEIEALNTLKANIDRQYVFQDEFDNYFVKSAASGIDEVLVTGNINPKKL
jgi:hypothetical protein